MSFFEPLVSGEPERRSAPEWAEPPPGVIGALVDAQIVLVETNDVFALVDNVRAYPNGFEFTLSVLLREPHYGDPPWDRMRGGNDDELMRFGLLFGDGSKWTATSMSFPHPGEAPAGPIVMPQGGSGSGDKWQSRYWAWPLPPPGDLTFVIEWPARQVAESVVSIDAQLIRDRADDARRVWPAPE